MDAVRGLSDVEVDEEAHLEACELEAGQELRFVDRQEGLDGLQLEDQPAADHKVQDQLAVELPALIADRQALLPLERNPPKIQLPLKCLLVQTLQEPGAKLP